MNRLHQDNHSLARVDPPPCLQAAVPTFTLVHRAGKSHITRIGNIKALRPLKHSTPFWLAQFRNQFITV